MSKRRRRLTRGVLSEFTEFNWHGNDHVEHENRKHRGGWFRDFLTLTLSIHEVNCSTDGRIKCKVINLSEFWVITRILMREHMCRRMAGWAFMAFTEAEGQSRKESACLFMTHEDLVITINLNVGHTFFYRKLASRNNFSPLIASHKLHPEK